jgi:ubiquitin
MNEAIYFDVVPMTMSEGAYHGGENFILVLDDEISDSKLSEAVELHTQCPLSEFELRKSTGGMRRQRARSGPTPYYFDVGILSVRTLTGRIIALKHKYSDTIQTLKSKIEDKEDIPPSQQRLVYKGRHLENGIVAQHTKVAALLIDG